MMPGSAVSVTKSNSFSSAATEATPSGMPMPRLTTPPIGKFQRTAARNDLAVIECHRDIAIRSGARNSPENAPSVAVA